MGEGRLWERLRIYSGKYLFNKRTFYLETFLNSLKKSVKPEIVNRYDLWVLRLKIGGAKVFVNNVQWSDQMM